jgi:lysophospholipid acyltransferase (LPLAT)-like uncharacterized protein
MATPAAPGVDRPAPFAWLARTLGFGLALYLRLVARTCRVSGAVTSEQVILAFWHEFNMASFVVACKLRRSLPHGSFSTRGFRGTMIDTELRHSGVRVRVLPLPPERDRAAGAAFARRLSRLAEEGFSPIVTPDGPFGPAHIAKPGTLIVAREAGLPIQPWAIAVRPGIRLSGRWDRQVLPLPFSRFRVVQGAPMRIGPREAIKPRLPELQAELDRVTARARQAR